MIPLASIAFLALALYLLPASIAACRNHPNLAAITVVNLLLGWTFVFWVIALVWASTVSVEVRRHG